MVKKIKKCKNCPVDISHRHALTLFCTEACKINYNNPNRMPVVKKLKVEKIPVLPYIPYSKYFDG